MARQRHDIGRRKWEASEQARHAAEQRRIRRARLIRRRKTRAARAAAETPEAIATWRSAQRKSERS